MLFRIFEQPNSNSTFRWTSLWIQKQRVRISQTIFVSCHRWRITSFRNDLRFNNRFINHCQTLHLNSIHRRERKGIQHFQYFSFFRVEEGSPARSTHTQRNSCYMGITYKLFWTLLFLFALSAWKEPCRKPIHSAYSRMVYAGTIASNCNNWFEHEGIKIRLLNPQKIWCHATLASSKVAPTSKVKCAK